MAAAAVPWRMRDGHRLRGGTGRPIVPRAKVATKRSRTGSHLTTGHISNQFKLELPVTAIILHIFRFTNLLVWQVDV